jgi:hypothetical protein
MVLMTACDERVDANHLVPGALEPLNQMGADESG